MGCEATIERETLAGLVRFAAVAKENMWAACRAEELDLETREWLFVVDGWVREGMTALGAVNESSAAGSPI